MPCRASHRKSWSNRSLGIPFHVTCNDTEGKGRVLWYCGASDAESTDNSFNRQNSIISFFFYDELFCEQYMESKPDCVYHLEC